VRYPPNPNNTASSSVDRLDHRRLVASGTVLKATACLVQKRCNLFFCRRKGRETSDLVGDQPDVLTMAVDTHHEICCLMSPFSRRL
ncbi:unnamed protein product, partial [Musa acuminata var. zebrina]